MKLYSMLLFFIVYLLYEKSKTSELDKQVVPNQATLLLQVVSVCRL